MWLVKRILVPTDFSKASEAALDAAIELANKFDASIVLFHAYQIPAYAFPVAPIVLMSEVTATLQDSADKALDELAARARVHGVVVSKELRVGLPWEEILRTSKEMRVNLIVMGSRGLSGISRALLGSTAERVVRHSPVPVMTLHGQLHMASEQEEGAKEADELVDGGWYDAPRRGDFRARRHRAHAAFARGRQRGAGRPSR